MLDVVDVAPLVVLCLVGRKKGGLRELRGEVKWILKCGGRTGYWRKKWVLQLFQTKVFNKDGF